MIGVFDSGIGGLSILQALRAELPEQDYLYVADNAHAPYGEREPAHIIDRSLRLTEYLRTEGATMVVVACNTATAAAIQALRGAYPQLPIVGVEPAIKPAAATTRTGRVGVIGTRNTLFSAKFQALLKTCSTQTEFVVQPCDGLAHAIERSATDTNALEVTALCEDYIRAMGPFGSQSGQMDTLVLGCTHYSFVRDTLRDMVGPAVTLLDTGEPVARQVRRLLTAAVVAAPGQVRLQTTGTALGLHGAAERWLGLTAPVDVLGL